MNVAGAHYRSIWLEPSTGLPRIIDQTQLPHRFTTRDLTDLESGIEAISTMRVRGAPLIGATAAHTIAVHLASDPGDEALAQAQTRLLASRPTAINLRWAVDRVVAAVRPLARGERAAHARQLAKQICDEDAAACEAIGEHGLALLRELVEERARLGRPVDPDHPLQVLTHCNAGWLATVDWGTALAPIYKAQVAGLPIHVWVDETRPRNQGASLTAFELREQGVAHTVIVDNAGGHLMQRGEVDAVLVGSDRTTASGDVCNKIGTYLKALAAHDNGVPFFVMLPLSSIDWTISDGLRDIPIEERGGDEVRKIAGQTSLADASEETVVHVQLFSSESPAANPAFDVTPSRYVSRIVTERGVSEANATGLARIRPDDLD